jgi:hypothetical protein
MRRERCEGDLELLNDDSGGGSSTVADTGDTDLARLEVVQEGDNDSGTGGSDGL